MPSFNVKIAASANGRRPERQRGGKTFPAAKKLAASMSEKQLKDFAKGPVKKK